MDRNIFDILKKCYNEKKEKIDEIRKLSETYPICLFGGGEFANSVEILLADNKIAVSGRFVDEKYLSANCNMTLEDSISKYGDIVVVIASVKPEVVKNHIAIFENNQSVKKVFFLGDNYPAGTAYVSYEYIEKNKELIEKVYDLLDDDLSRKSMISFLMAKLSGNAPKYLNQEGIVDSSGVEYFNPIFGEKLGNGKEIFVDGGAYDGDTYADFISQSIPFEKYYAFEPDPESYIKLKTISEADDRCVCINKGLYSSETTLCFSASGDMSSKIVDENNDVTKVEVVNIDSIAKDATFIKLDIEGAELDVLKGSVDTIKNNKPKLAICCYHKIDDIFEIPLFIKSLDSNYKLYYRMHQRDWCRDLILYAYC